MIGYKLKNILSLVPEALPLVKQANLEQDYPLDNKSGCAASALSIAYQIYHEKSPVDSMLMEKVASAVTAYGIDEEVARLTTMLCNRKPIEKTAAEVQHEICVEKQATFEASLNDFQGYPDIEELAKRAEFLYDECKTTGVDPSPSVAKYSASQYLSKEAALGALNARFYMTQDDTFVKIAAALSKEKEILPPGPLTRSLCRTVTGLDKKAGLHVKGFNFYKEALMEKSAAASATTVSLCGKPVSLQSIMKVPTHHLDNYLGKEFSKEIQSDPITAKAVVESLPMDMQHVLHTIVKNA